MVRVQRLVLTWSNALVLNLLLSSVDIHTRLPLSLHILRQQLGTCEVCSKVPRQTLLFTVHVLAAYCVGMLPLLGNRVHITHYLSPPFLVRDVVLVQAFSRFSPRLRDKIWEWPGDEAK